MMFFKEKPMETNNERSTLWWSFPAEETGKTLEALRRAGETDDIATLKWCVRRLLWLEEQTAEEIWGDCNFDTAWYFNLAWTESLKNDPVPDSIADIFEQKVQPGLSDDERDILGLFKKLSPENKSSILVYVENLEKEENKASDRIE
jgi:hypothetical protein